MSAVLERPVTDRHTAIHEAIDEAELLRAEWADSEGEGPPPAEIFLAMAKVVETLASGPIPAEDAGLVAQAENMADALLSLYSDEEFIAGRDHVNSRIWSVFDALLARRKHLRSEPAPLETIAELKSQNVDPKLATKITGWPLDQVRIEYEKPGTSTCVGEPPAAAVRRAEWIGETSDGFRLSCLAPALRAKRAFRPQG